jgi:hypothetical protein
MFMVLWSDPGKQGAEKEARSEHERTPGLVSARWLAIDSILRSLILDPEGPEMRAMMRRDILIMHATGALRECRTNPVDVYQEAADVMTTWRKSFS